jgi:hypothetical protein
LQNGWLIFREKLKEECLGELNVHGNWRTRYYNELMQLFGDLYTLSFVRISLLNWIGHVNRMDIKRKVSQVKSKAVPLQAWSGLEGSRKSRFPDFMTKAQDGGKVVSLTHRPHLPPGNPPGTHFC